MRPKVFARDKSSEWYAWQHAINHVNKSYEFSKFICLPVTSPLRSKKDITDCIKKLDKNKRYIFCPNHTSALDIPLVTSIIPLPLLYMGKKELASIPLFGYFYRKNSIIVDRSKLRDSYAAFIKAGNKLEEGLNVCIFPEGGIPKSSVFLKKFKNGPFKLAVEKNIEIVPITIADNKTHFPQEYFKGFPGIIRVKVHKAIKADKNDEKAIENLNTSVYNTIFEQLKNYEQ